MSITMLLFKISEIFFFVHYSDLNKESTDEDESRTSKVGDENMDRGGKGNDISGKRCSNNDEDEIPVDDIFLDELDGEDASSLSLKLIKLLKEFCHICLLCLLYEKQQNK